MRVHELMTREPATCAMHADLATAARRMQERDCGFLPVIDAHGRVTGVLTDRDIALAVAAKRRTAAKISVKEVATGRVFGVAPSDDLHAALRLMRDHQVRRLPVLDAYGVLKGVVSMNDIVLGADAGAGVPPAEVVDAFKGICAHRHVENKGI